MARRLDVAVRDHARDIVGDVARYRSASLTLRVNAPGEWELVLPADESAADLLAEPDAGIVADLDGVRLMSGPVLDWRGSRADDGTYAVTVRGTDDLGRLLMGATAWPKPAAAITAQSDAYHAVPAVGASPATDDAETVLKAFVSANAVTRLSVGGLTVATNTQRGSLLRGTARFDRFADLLPSLAEAGGLVMAVTYDHLTGGLVFDVSEPVDRSASIYLEDTMNNVLSYDLGRTAPLATRVVVGGQGELTARELLTVVDTAAEAAWGVWEDFLDATDVETGNTSLLTARGEAFLAEKAAAYSVSLEAQDTPQMTFGTHYALGDRVTALGVVDQIRQVVVTDTVGAGVVVRPTVGLPQGSDPLAWFAAVVRDLRGRLATVERRR